MGTPELVFQLPGYDILFILLSYAELFLLALKLGLMWAGWACLSEVCKVLRVLRKQWEKEE